MLRPYSNVLHQTPIEIKSDSKVIDQTLVMLLPQKSFGTAACPTAKMKRSV